MERKLPKRNSQILVDAVLFVTGNIRKFKPAFFVKCKAPIIFPSSLCLDLPVAS